MKSPLTPIRTTCRRRERSKPTCSFCSRRAHRHLNVWVYRVRPQAPPNKNTKYGGSPRKASAVIIEVTDSDSDSDAAIPARAPPRKTPSSPTKPSLSPAKPKPRPVPKARTPSSSQPQVTGISETALYVHPFAEYGESCVVARLTGASYPTVLALAYLASSTSPPISRTTCPRWHPRAHLRCHQNCSPERRGRAHRVAAALMLERPTAAQRC